MVLNKIPQFSEVKNWAKNNLTASDVGALADTYSAPVQSVNSKTGDVTVDSATQPAQVVATYDDLPLQNVTERKLYYVNNATIGDFVYPTQLSPDPVRWVSLSDYNIVAAEPPDSGNLQSRLDARKLSLSDQETITSSNLTDLADSNNAVTVASGDPIYETSQVAGEPAITIGANERIEITFDAQISTPYSVFVLGQYNQLNQGTHIWAVDPIPSSGFVGHMPGNVSPNDFVYKRNGGGNPTLQAENSNANIFNDIITGSSQDSRLNGNPEVTASISASNLDGISLGGRVDGGGKSGSIDLSITEILVYGVDENSNETDIESYLDRSTTLT